MPLAVARAVLIPRLWPLVLRGWLCHAAGRLMACAVYAQKLASSVRGQADRDYLLGDGTGGA
jgi:hypothetical protein